MPISKIKSSSITADAASTNLNIDAGTLFLDTTNNRVGVSNTAPDVKLQVTDTIDVGIAMSNSSSVTTGNRGSLAMFNSANSTVGLIRFGAVTDNVGTDIQFYTRPAAGALSQTMTLTSAGNLGIGTTSPTFLSGGGLEVYNSSVARLKLTNSTTGTASTDGLDIHINSTDANIIVRESFPLIVYTSNTERMRITSSGDVGIGTTTMTRNFNIGGSGAGVGLSVNNTGTSGRSYSIFSTNSGAAVTGALGFYDDTAGAYRMVISSSGNLGIGTTSPKSDDGGNKLEISDSANTVVTITATNDTTPILNFRSNAVDRLSILSSSNYGANFLVRSNQDMRFGTNNTERMRITSAGAVGIATSDPAATLDVATSSGSAGQVNTHIMLSRGTSTGGFLQTERAAASNNVSALILGVNSAERMRITDAGFVGIANNAPGLALDVTGQIRGTTVLIYNAGTPTTPGNTTPTFFSPSSGVLGLVNNGSESFRVASNGNFLVGGTTIDTGFAVIKGVTYGESYIRMNHPLNTPSGYGYADFTYHTSMIGNIAQSGTTSVSYNTTSDYRLKNTIAPMTGALAKVALLKPCTYKWNADGSDGQGFIAHELAEVVPQCVSGEKDAVNTDGSIKSQGVDTSFLVATLTAAIQEQQTLITQLTERIAALENK